MGSKTESIGRRRKGKKRSEWTDTEKRDEEKKEKFSSVAYFFHLIYGRDLKGFAEVKSKNELV